MDQCSNGQLLVLTLYLIYQKMWQINHSLLLKIQNTPSPWIKTLQSIGFPSFSMILLFRLLYISSFLIPNLIFYFILVWWHFSKKKMKSIKLKKLVFCYISCVCAYMNTFWTEPFLKLLRAWKFISLSFGIYLRIRPFSLWHQPHL